MMKKLIHLALIFTTLVTSGCNLPQKPKPSDKIATISAQTIQALSTQLAGGTPQPATDGNPTLPPTITLPPLITFTPLPTILPTAVPSATSVPVPCDRGSFIGDVTIPDGTIMTPGVVFTKTWQLKNNGTCSWNTNYALVFTDVGNAMNGPVSKPLIASGTVEPGQTIQVSLDLTAPTSEGTYRGEWKLRNANGVVFGIGLGADMPFWVEIKVSTSLKFTDLLCSAEWKSGAGTLTCPGSDGDSKGFVFKVDKPTLENGTVDNEPALVMAPQAVTDGQITGKFPAIKVPANSFFRAVIGCTSKTGSCSVKMKVLYQAAGEAEATLGEWTETADGKMTGVAVDLQALGLSGKQVTFKLVVEANGSPSQDKVFWLLPRISP
jgi:hypothetical protein